MPRRAKRKNPSNLGKALNDLHGAADSLKQSMKNMRSQEYTPAAKAKINRAFEHVLHAGVLLEDLLGV